MPSNVLTSSDSKSSSFPTSASPDVAAIIVGDSSRNVVAGSSLTIAVGEGELDRLLARLISKDALHDSWYSPPECHPGTRKTVCKEINGWIDKGSPLLWLYGPAGVGKSVIAKTIAGHNKEVVATFFFSTSSERSAATLFPTVAWQLAQKIPVHVLIVYKCIRL